MVALGMTLSSGAVQGLAVTYLPSILNASDGEAGNAEAFSMIALVLTGAALQSLTHVLTVRLWIDLRAKGRSQLVISARKVRTRVDQVSMDQPDPGLDNPVFDVVRGLNGSLNRASLGTRQLLGASSAIITSAALIIAAARLNAPLAAVGFLPVIITGFALVRLYGSRLVLNEKSARQSLIEDRIALKQILLTGSVDGSSQKKLLLSGDLLLYRRIRTPQLAKLAVLLASAPLVGLLVFYSGATNDELGISTTIVLLGALLVATTRLSVAVESLTRITRFTFHLTAFRKGILDLDECKTVEELRNIVGQIGSEDEETDY